MVGCVISEESERVNGGGGGGGRQKSGPHGLRYANNFTSRHGNPVGGKPGDLRGFSIATGLKISKLFLFYTVIMFYVVPCIVI